MRPIRLPGLPSTGKSASVCPPHSLQKSKAALSDSLTLHIINRY